MLIILLCFASHIFFNLLYIYQFLITPTVHSSTFTHVRDPLRLPHRLPLKRLHMLNNINAKLDLYPVCIHVGFTYTPDWVPFSVLVALWIWMSRVKNGQFAVKRGLVSECWKASGSRLCTVCAEKYKMDFICWDLKLYVVLPVLQHKTFIINLWIELL